MNKNLKDVLISIHHKYLLGKFTGDIFHEVNNIVGASIGFAQLAQISMKEDDIKKMIEVVLRSTGRVKEISRSAQNYLSDYNGSAGINDVSLLISDCIQLVKKSFTKKGAQISFNNNGIISFSTNTGLLRHAVLSMISFLFENLENGGTVSVNVEKAGSEKIKISFFYEKISSTHIDTIMHASEEENSFENLYKDDAVTRYYDGYVALYVLKNKLGGTIIGSPDSITVLLDEKNYNL